MRIAVAGSIATDHLLSFDGRFKDSLLEGQTDKVSLSFLASGLEVRRGGTGANIAFGLGVLGERPVLVGAVGQDAKDYLQWLSDHGVDTSGVHVSAERATARFTCTTDRDLNQIATFYPGAMSEAAQLRFAPLGGFDLVVVAPDDPAAMVAHAQECREAGTPFVADPSQQLAWSDGPWIRDFVTGAEYLFTNEYESGLVHEKTGWTSEQVLEQVGTRVTTHGVEGVIVERRGEQPVRVGVVPAKEVAEPTGVGDAFRAGFLAATAWGLGTERRCQVGALLATLVVETVGTQEYAFSTPDVLDRLTEAYGPDCADEVRPHLPAS